MRASWLLIAFLVLLESPLWAGTKHRELTIGGRKVDLVTAQDSVEGTFLLAMAEADPDKLKPPMKNHLVALNTDGKVLFERSFEHRYRVMLAVDFRPIGNGLYGYFLCFQQAIACGEASYHFLDSDFHDVFPIQVPNQDKEFDSHDLIRAPNGNTFFMFLRHNFKKAQAFAEIQEWTPRGDVVFSWRVQDHLKFQRYPELIDSIHINSIDRDEDGGILLSLLVPSKIVKIAYPSGKQIWEVSRDWTFVNDPFNGFRQQHSIRHLKNGNILLFDNGEKNRPSRAVEYKLDFANKKAELVWEYRCPDAEVSYRMIGGSVQRLSNGNTLIGWGLPPLPFEKPGTPLTVFTEVSADRKMVRELKSSASQALYRVWFQEK